HRALMDWSALYRWASYAAAQARIRKFDRPNADNPLVTIGLPGYQLPKLLTAREGQAVAAPANEKALGRRVTEEERQANLERLPPTAPGDGGTQLLPPTLPFQPPT